MNDWADLRELLNPGAALSPRDEGTPTRGSRQGCRTSVLWGRLAELGVNLGTELLGIVQ